MTVNIPLVEASATSSIKHPTYRVAMQSNQGLASQPRTAGSSGPPKASFNNDHIQHDPQGPALPRVKQFKCEGHRKKGTGDCPYDQEYDLATSRNAVSNFFGGNKANFKQIAKDKRALMCRMCYQHTKYDSTEYAKIKLEYIRKMLDRVEEQFPDGQFFIKFQEGLQKKYNAYLDARHQHSLREEDNQWFSPRLFGILFDAQWAQKKVEHDEELERDKKAEQDKKVEHDKQTEHDDKAEGQRESQSKKVGPAPSNDVCETPIEWMIAAKAMYLSKGVSNHKTGVYGKTDGDIEHFIGIMTWLLKHELMQVVMPIEFLPELQTKKRARTDEEEVSILFKAAERSSSSTPSKRSKLSASSCHA